MFHKLAYKLSRDAIFLVLLGLAIFLIAEGLKPYVLTGIVSFTKIIILLLTLLLLSEFLSKKAGVVNTETKPNKKAILFWLFLALALILLNSIKFSIFSGLIIAVAAVWIIYDLRKSKVSRAHLSQENFSE